MESSCLGNAASPLSDEEREMLKNEQSRAVKICFIAVKCFIFTAMFILLLFQFAHTVIKDFMSTDTFMKHIEEMTKFYSRKNTIQDLVFQNETD